MHHHRLLLSVGWNLLVGRQTSVAHTQGAAAPECWSRDNRPARPDMGPHVITAHTKMKITKQLFFVEIAMRFQYYVVVQDVEAWWWLGSCTQPVGMRSTTSWEVAVGNNNRMARLQQQCVRDPNNGGRSNAGQKRAWIITSRAQSILYLGRVHLSDKVLLFTSSSESIYTRIKRSAVHIITQPLPGQDDEWMNE